MQNNTITLKGVTETHIILAVNGKDNEILLNSDDFEQFLQSYNQTTFQSGNTIYNIEEIKTATFVFQIKSIAPKPKLLNKIPLALPPKVIGRKSDLEKVEELLFKDNALVIVNGIGGIGKTVLSHYYWQERQYKYTHLLWLKGEGNLQDSLINDHHLHAGLGIVEEMKYHLEAIRQPNNAQAKEQAFACVAAALKNVTPKGLMLIDNASEENRWMIKQWKTTFNNFHILGTSRNIFDDICTYSLGFLNKDEAKELFYLYYDSDNQLPHNDNAVEEITWFAGYHTLTIELLAKTLRAHKERLTFDSLLLQLHQNPVYLEKARKVGTPYTLTEDYIYNILELCFDLSEITQYEVNTSLLRYFSILPSYDVKATDLEEMLNITDENEETYLDALEALVYNGWIQERYENEYRYDCHTIIQTIVRKKLNPNMGNCEILVENLNIIILKHGTMNLHYAAKWLYYTNQILNIFPSNDIRIISLYVNISPIYLALGDYERALIYNLKAIEIGEEMFGRDVIALVPSYNNIANTYLHIAEYNQALVFILKSIDIQEKATTKDETILGVSYTNLGVTYMYLGNYGNSLKYYHKAIQIETNIFGEKNINLAITYCGIANTYGCIAKYNEALTYSLMGIKILEKVLENGHPMLAKGYNDLAIIYKNLEQYNNALIYTLKAIEIQELVLGKSNPNNSSYYNTLGNIYRHIGEYKKSIDAVSKAIEIREQVFPKNYFKIGQYHNNLANTYKCLYDYDKALFLYKKAIEMFEKVVGQFHPESSIPYDNIASVYSDTQDWEQAIKHEKQALIICLKSLSLGNIKTAKYVDSMYHILKKATQAEGQAKYQAEIDWYHENCDQYLQ